MISDKMPIVSLHLKEVEAKKLMEPTGNVEINNKVGESNVREQDMPGLDKKGLAIEFKYMSQYMREKELIAEIRITGEALYIGDDCKDILNKWKKEGILPENVHLGVINTAFRRCSVKALVLAEDLQLPPPINLPFAKKEE